MVGGFKYAWDGVFTSFAFAFDFDFGLGFAVGRDTVNVGLWSGELFVCGLEVRGKGLFDSCDLSRPVGCSSSYDDLDKE